MEGGYSNAPPGPHLVVFSHKACWPAEPGQFATDGGFPFQMEALSQLFERTTLVLPRSSSAVPSGLKPLRGLNLEVETFPEPGGTGLRRKLVWLVGGARRVAFLWRWAGRGDVVHAAVPGDVGFLGLVLALLRRRRIFVRHCGTWGRFGTLADRLLHFVLTRVAGERCVVFATGGGLGPPSKKNASIRWIFSTSLAASQLEDLETRRQAPPRRLISVGRLTAGKNVESTIRALAELRNEFPQLELDVLGHGAEAPRLKALATELGLGNAVTFVGNLDHDGVLEHLLRARVFVFPTRVAEGFPKAVLEALACGVPVVVPRVSVLPYLLAEGGGVLLDDVDSSHVSDAIRSLLDDPSSYDRHALAARQIAQSYTLEAWRDAIGERLASAWGEDLRVGSAF